MVASPVTVQDPNTPANQLAVNGLGQVGISNFPPTQSIIGNVMVTNFPSNQVVSGTIAVTNFPTSTAVASLPGGTSSIPFYEVIQDPTTPANRLKVNSDGSINAAITSGESTSTTIQDGTASSQKLAVDSGGNASVNVGKVGGVAVVLGRTTKSASIPVTMASDQDSMNVAVTDTSAVGSVTNANDAVSITLPGGQSTVTAQILGTFVGTLNFEASPDSGTTWYSIQGSQVGTSAQASTATAPGAWRVGVAGFTAFRVRLSPVTSGSANVTLRLTQGVYNVFINNATALGQAVMASSAPVVLASDQSNVPIKAGFTEQASLSAGALNADLVPATDVSAYKWLSLHLTGTYTGTLTFQSSNDNTNWDSVVLYRLNSASGTSAGSTTSITNAIFAGPVSFRYFRVRMTSYTSGTVNGTLELYTIAPAYQVITVFASQSGTWTVQPGNTANTTPWLSTINQGGNSATVTGSNALKVDGSAVTQPVSGTFWQSTQPVSGTVTANAGTGTMNVAQQASGSVSATLQNAATTTGVGTTLTVLGMASVAFTVSGTFTGLSITWQGTEDGSNWSSLLATQLGTNTISATATAVGDYEASCAGLQQVRANVTALASNNVTVTAHAVPVTFSTRVVNANLLAGSASIGNVGLNAGSAVIGSTTIQATSGTALQADQSNTELKVSNYVKTTTAGDTALTLGQATMANSLPVVLASDQSTLPFNLKQIGGISTQMASGDGEGQANTLFQALGLYNSGGPADSTGKPQQLSYDRLRAFQGKATQTGTITATAANDTNLVFSAAPKTIMPGQLINLAVGSGTPVETVKVAESYTPSSTATSIPLQTSVVTAGSTQARWDIFNPIGPGISAFYPFGVLPVIPAMQDAGGSGNAFAFVNSGFDGLSTNRGLAVQLYSYNGSTEDRVRGNLDNITLVALGAYTTTQTSTDQTNYNGRGVIVTLDVTNVASAPSVTLEIDMKDPVSGKYISLLTGAAVTTVSTTIYTVYPGAPATTNVSANAPLPRTWRVKVVANNANSGTYSVGAAVIV